MGNKASTDKDADKSKSRKKGSASDSGKLAYKRQFSLEDAREKQQTLVDYYASSSYNSGGLDSSSNDDQKTTDKIQDKINATAAKTLSPGVKLAGDEEHFETLSKADQLASQSQPRRKPSNMMPRPSQLLTNLSKIELESENEIKKFKTMIIEEEANNPNFAHSHPIQWGYCELTRKQLDEDQAAFATWKHDKEGLVHAWAVFDGHGGYEVALYSAQHFLKYVEKYHKTRQDGVKESEWPKLFKDIFVNFDKHIGTLNLKGGCTVVIVLLVGFRLIIANAGDARAIMSKWDGKAGQLSYDHTPLADYDRVVRLVKSEKYNAMITKYFRINDKHETIHDIQKLPASQIKKAPLISRELEKSRLLATIGVARGFGDFNLTVFGFRNIPIKPFLSCEPWVNIVELKKTEIGETDVLVIACDGVYDVLHNQDIIDKIRYELFFDQDMMPPRRMDTKTKSTSSMTKTKSMSKSKSQSRSKKGDKANVGYVEPKVKNTTNYKYNSDNNGDTGPNSPTGPNTEYETKEVEDPSGKKRMIEIKPFEYDRLDDICNDLGRLCYKKGTLDDVSVFIIPLRQVFRCIH